MKKTKRGQSLSDDERDIKGNDSWYLKYRPRTISELDQESVRNSLFGFVKNRKIPHALLFSGPKGTGKTSAARIIAKILNCEKTSKGDLAEPCNLCNSCLSVNSGRSMSVIELDAASNRGIEDIRAVREAAKLSVPGKARVYIIDEAHMLTLEAANALLKTLEEPPPHVVFILATTDAGRLPETIRSRATTINFKRATDGELLGALSRVLDGEKLELGEDTLSSIANAADGSFRDAIKILEQVVGGDKNSLQKISPDNLLLFMAQGKLKEAIGEIERVGAIGVGMGNYIVSILERLREILILRIGVVTFGAEDIPEFKTVDELKRLIGLFSDAARFISLSPVPSIPLEMVVVEWCGNSDKEVSQSIHLSRNSDPSTTPRRTGPRASAATSHRLQPLGPSSNKRELRSSTSSASSHQTVSLPPQSSISEEVWSKILDGTKAKNHTIAALLRSAKPVGIRDGKMQILVFYQFHKDRLEDGKNIVIVEEVLSRILGGSIGVEFTLGEKLKEVISDKKQVTREEVDKESIIKEQTLTETEDIERVAEEIFGGKLEN